MKPRFQGPNPKPNGLALFSPSQRRRDVEPLFRCPGPVEAAPSVASDEPRKSLSVGGFGNSGVGEFRILGSQGLRNSEFGESRLFQLRYFKARRASKQVVARVRSFHTMASYSNDIDDSSHLRRLTWQASGL